MAHTRRGTRIPVHIQVTITSLDTTNWFYESGLVILANQHGCAVRIPRKVGINTAVLIEGLPSETTASARVANCISLGEYEKFWLLGLELDEPGNVWGIETPPGDWQEVEPASWVDRVLHALEFAASKKKSDTVLH